MQKYVLGFLFTDNCNNMEKEVALIRKTHPEWQKGKLNGIGGHIEEGEEPVDAMTREFKEETDAGCDWKFFCTMVFDNDTIIYCFKSNSIAEIKTITDEDVNWYKIKDIVNSNNEDIIPNLRWLIPMALQKEDGMNTVDLVLLKY